MDDFLRKYHEDEILEILHSCNILKASLNIDLNLVNSHNPHLFKKIVSDVHGELKKYNSAIRKLQLVLIESLAVLKGICDTQQHIYARFINLPTTAPDTYPSNKNVGELVELKGTITYCQDNKLQEILRIYTCKKCKQSEIIESKYNEMYQFPTQLKRCPNNCKNSFLMYEEVEVPDFSMCIDTQQLRIQEHTKKTNIAKLMNVSIDNELVECFRPGERVIVCGTVEICWTHNEPILTLRSVGIQKDNVRAKINRNMIEHLLLISASFEEDLTKFGEMTMRDLIIQSLCPSIHGLYMIKLAMALILCSSSGEESGDSSKTRGVCHLMLVGDPGMGKSKLLAAATNCAPISVAITGFSSTAAGLTAAASKENGMWHLEAGALVMADKGLCVIDEFSLMRSTEQENLLDAMEQQHIKIAKAGIISKLNTRCSVIVGMNPKTVGQVDEYGNIPIEHLGIHPALLSRFDIVLAMRSINDTEWDHKVSNFIFDIDTSLKDKRLWTEDKIQSHLLAAREIIPEFTDDVHAVLKSYYLFYRDCEKRDRTRTTVRFLDSLMRLTKAHACLVLRHHTKIVDALTVIQLMESSYNFGHLFKTASIITKDVPLFPGADEITMMLRKLDLEHLIEKAFAEIGLKSEPEIKQEFPCMSQIFHKSQIDSKVVNISMQIPIKKNLEDDISSFNFFDMPVKNELDLEPKQSFETKKRKNVNQNPVVIDEIVNNFDFCEDLQLAIEQTVMDKIVPLPKKMKKTPNAPKSTAAKRAAINIAKRTKDYVDDGISASQVENGLQNLFEHFKCDSNTDETLEVFIPETVKELPNPQELPLKSNIAIKTLEKLSKFTYEPKEEKTDNNIAPKSMEVQTNNLSHAHGFFRRKLNSTEERELDNYLENIEF